MNYARKAIDSAKDIVAPWLSIVLGNMLLKSYIRELYSSIYKIQKRIKDKFDTRRSKIEVL